MNLLKRNTGFQKLILVLLIGSISFLFAFTETEKNTAYSKLQTPNIVVILADDMGYGDIKSFNPNSQIPTPNLDRLAGRGIKFTDAHSGSAVCSPTRYGLITGRYAFRSSLKKGVLGGAKKLKTELDEQNAIGFTRPGASN